MKLNSVVALAISGFCAASFSYAAPVTQTVDDPAAVQSPSSAAMPDNSTNTNGLPQGSDMASPTGDATTPDNQPTTSSDTSSDDMSADDGATKDDQQNGGEDDY